MVTLKVLEFCLSTFPLTIFLLSKRRTLNSTEIAGDVMRLSCRDFVLDDFHVISESFCLSQHKYSFQRVLHIYIIIPTEF